MNRGMPPWIWEFEYSGFEECFVLQKDLDISFSCSGLPYPQFNLVSGGGENSKQ